MVVVRALLLIVGLALTSGTHAQDYPMHPVTIVVPTGPGGGMETVARLLAPKLEQRFGKPFVIENRPGAGTNIGAAAVARSAPDGYTLLMATNSPLSADPFLHKNVNYDPIKDFTPVTRVGSFTLMLVINPKLPIHSVKELVDYAKTNPGKLSFASGNTAGIVAGDTLSHWAGINLIHVPYTSTPPALQDIIAGRVSMMFADFTTAMPHVSAHALRALAVTRIKRSKLFPEMPTMDEAGVKGFNLDAWAGFVVAAGTPPAIVTKLNKTLRPIIDSPEVQAKFKNVGFEGFSSTSEELGNYIKEQLVEWKKMVKDANIQAD